MKEIPILFSTPMVQAILAGNKTQTRRIVKPQPVDSYFQSLVHHASGRFTFVKNGNYNPTQNDVLEVKCPYGQSGDIIWVRENYKIYINSGGKQIYFAFEETDHLFPFYYKQLTLNTLKKIMARDLRHDEWHSSPSIHMYKESARIWLQIESIRVERLRDISEEDSSAEGVLKLEDGRYKNYLNGTSCQCETAKLGFTTLWCNINGTDSWNSNPWVWAITFKVLSTTGKPTL